MFASIIVLNCILSSQWMPFFQLLLIIFLVLSQKHVYIHTLLLPMSKLLTINSTSVNYCKAERIKKKHQKMLCDY